MDARARRGDLRHPARADRRARARLRHDQAGGDPSQLRHAADARRRQRRARGRVPAGAGRRVARSGRRCVAVVVGHFPVDSAALERPDLIHGAAAHDQHVGDRRCVARCARSARFARSTSTTRIRWRSRRIRRSVVAGFRARGPVLRRARDLQDRHRGLSPTSCCPRRRSSSRPTSTIRTAISTRSPTTRRSRRIAEALPNTEVFRRLAARMGFDDPCFSESDDDARARTRSARATSRAQGIDWDTLKQRGWQRLNVPRPYAPFANGGFPDAVGQVRVLVRSARGAGTGSAARLPAAARVGGVATRRSRDRYPLGFISPPARNFLNSSFREPAGVPGRGKDAASRHPSRRCRRARHRRTAIRCASSTIAAALLATARVTDRARPGVVVAPSVWWRKLAPGGENANAVTSQALTDLGRAATFYDCLVEVRPA